MLEVNESSYGSLDALQAGAPAPAPSSGGDGSDAFRWTVGKASQPELRGDAAGACRRPPGCALFETQDAKPNTTPPQVFLSLALFLAAGVAEIGGGWLVWQAVRLHKGWWLALLGALVLFCYGLIPCAQPVDNFGRVRALAAAAVGMRFSRSGGVAARPARRLGARAGRRAAARLA